MTNTAESAEAKRPVKQPKVRAFIALFRGLSGAQTRAQQRARWRRLASRVSIAQAFGTGSASVAAILAVGAGLLVRSSPARAVAILPEGLVEAGRSSVAVAMRQAALKVYAISPAFGPAGSEVTITGFGFMADNAIHFGDRVILHVAVKSAIGIACTPSLNCRGGIRQTLAFTIPDVPPGPYGVWVENSNGKSKTATFTVTRS
jgi:hypothetical protein